VSIQQPMSRCSSLLAAAIACVLAGCTGAPPVAPAQAVPPAPSAASLAKKELAPTGALRVAVFTANPVVGGKDKGTGALTGTGVVLGKTLAERAGVPCTLIEYTRVDALMGDARGGGWDIALMAIDPARTSVLDFGPPLLSVELTYLVPRKSKIHHASDADRSGVRIAVARGTVPALILLRTLKHARIVPAENEAAALDLLRRGKVNAYAQNRAMLNGLIGSVSGAHVLSDGFASVEMSLALPKGRPAALSYVKDFAEQARRSGIVARAIEAAGMNDVDLAPAL
jgi:polar amino acid transport system substrate-binding protein